MSEERIIPDAAAFASAASRATVLWTNTLQSLLVTAVVLWVLDIPRQWFGLALYTEQLLAVCLGLTLGLAYLADTSRPRNWLDWTAAIVSLVLCFYIAARYEQLLFVFADLRGRLLDILRAHERLFYLAAVFVFQTGDACAQRSGLGLLFAQAGDTHRVVETDNQIVLPDDLADFDGNLLNHPGLTGLDDLGLRRGNDLAVAARDLIDLRIGCPDDEGDKKRPDDKH